MPRLRRPLRRRFANGHPCTSESGPVNGVIDPAETVTLLFGLLNTKGTNTTSLVATLLATNGVPKAWLADYGWTNNFDAAATNDADGDHVATWEEYYAGTDPTNDSSFFQCLEISKTNLPTLGQSATPHRRNNPLVAGPP